MSDSPLAIDWVLTDNHSGTRSHAIDTITPHYMCWYATAEQCAESFQDSTRQASANYCVGKYGDIVLNVHEAYRAWTTGSAANDNRAVTIECANHMEDADGHVYGQLPDATWDALVRLCADVCERNGKSRLVYRGRADYSGLAPTDMLLTKHKWFQNTDCPGPWLDMQFGRLADEVNRRLGDGVRIDMANEAAELHYFMALDPRFGYSQYPYRWGEDGDGPIVFTSSSGRKYVLDPGSFDCSSSEIYVWRLVLKGTPYEGVLDSATCTSDMVEAFVGSGLFTSSLTPARRGDLYVNEGVHTAMCQDGGDDDVFGYDCLTEFNANENGGAYYGEPGDQTGYESIFRGYYNDGWNTVLHYNHLADYEVEEEAVIPTQPKSDPKNNYGMWYRVHAQEAGWLAPVHDGQTAGTEGYAARAEGLKITPPDGVDLDVYTHVQGVGNLYYDHVCKGVYDPVMGSVGQSRRMEAFRIDVNALPEKLRGRHLRYQGHVQGIGWTAVCGEGQWCGTRGEGRRLEALKIWFE